MISTLKKAGKARLAEKYPDMRLPFAAFLAFKESTGLRGSTLASYTNLFKLLSKEKDLTDDGDCQNVTILK